MLPIQHKPILDISKVERLFSQRDGVPIKYVCTSALGNEHFAGDIFYRDTPHPEFGNRYFQLYGFTSQPDDLRGYIRSADSIEDQYFTMIESEGMWLYSQHRHDYVSGVCGNIDGGRAYVRIVGNNVKQVTFKIKDGEFVEITVEHPS